MMRGFIDRQVPARVVIGLIGLPALLGITVVGGELRERRALPDATAQLRLAVNEAASMLSCFEGVQDEGSVEAASSRLSGCGVSGLATLVEAIDLPPAPPISPSRQRAARTSIEQAKEILQRVVLDVNGTRQAMVADLDGAPNMGDALVLGYRAAYAGYRRAIEMLLRAEVMLR
jgi:hypothetical protein